MTFKTVCSHLYNSQKKEPSTTIDCLAFEQRGADVSFEATIGISAPENFYFETRPYSEGFDSLVKQRSFRVELKPSVGDDYPAILREMIAHESNVLLIGKGGYGGIGATFEQLKKIFGASQIRVILLEDIPTTGKEGD
jgi:hypothetical protein